MSGLGRLPSKHATTWLYAPHVITQHCCKFGIGRVPQVSSAHSLDIKSEGRLYPFLAPDGLTVVIVENNDSSCYSWNHDTAQFHPVQFDDQVHTHHDPLPVYSPDGRLFACWSHHDSHVRVWDTQTSRLVSKFSTSKMDRIALSPALIEHPAVDRLIALKCGSERTICLFDVYTGHLYAQISGQRNANMAFIGDGTKLVYYSSDMSLRIWDIADLTDEHWHSTHGYQPILQGMTDRWVMGRDNEPLFWVPVEHREKPFVLPSHSVVIGIPRKKAMSMDLSNSRLSRKWTECIDKGWLREFEQKEKEVGNLLVRTVVSD